MKNIKVFSGTASKKLSSAICKKLNINLGNLEIRRFSDGEIFVDIDESVTEIYEEYCNCFRLDLGVPIDSEEAKKLSLDDPKYHEMMIEKNCTARQSPSPPPPQFSSSRRHEL